MRSHSIKVILSLSYSVTLFWKYEGKEIDLKTFHQSDYKLSFERAELSSYNKKYLDYFNVTTFKYNRTSAAFNMSYHYKESDIILSKLIIVAQCYKFASNEYRHFPLRFQMNMCDAYNNDVIGLQSSTTCKNYQGCPMKKEKHYHVCNFMPDGGKLPPFIPTGRYKLELNGRYSGIDLWNMYIAGEIMRPFNKK